ncbi:hypothetical protein MKEN_01282900 [Mycena kentingensis (nom. inval.)]|nr:hypothetical protein MKEN_01282900 [Mycena kentingensis (nom. inval.)]
MSRPFRRVRCAWFDDVKNPICGGCRSKMCTYVHPNDPEWPTAMRKKLNSEDYPNSNAAANRRPPMPLSSRDEQRSEQDRLFKEREKAYRAFGGGTSSSSSTSARTGANAGGAQTQQDGGWGGKSFGKQKTATTEVSSAASAPEKKDDGGWGSGGWGESSGGWDAASADSGGWGAPAKSANSGGGGWADSTTIGSGWATGNDVGGGWQTEAPKDKGKGRASDVVGWGGASTSKTTDSGWGGGGWGETTTTTNTDSGWGGGGWGEVNDAPKPAADPPPVPPPFVFRPPLQISTNDDGPLKSADVPLKSAAYQADSASVSIGPMPFSAAKESVRVAEMSREEIEFATVRNTIRAVYHQVKLRKTRQEYAQFKKAQTAPWFQHCTQGARAILTKTRDTMKGNEFGVQGRLNQSMKMLYELPELPASREAITLEQIDQEVMAYCEQLSTWLTQLERVVRPEPSPPSMTNPVKDQPMSLAAIVEEKLKLVESNMNDVLDLYVELTEKNRAEYIDPVLDALAQSQTDVETHLEEQFQDMALKVVQLADETDKLEVRAAQLEKDCKQQQLLKETMANQLARLEEKQRLRRAKLTSLREEVAAYAANPPIPPAAMDAAILPRATEMVRDMITMEVQPALDARQAQVASAIERRMAMLVESLQPVMEQTEKICAAIN